MNTKSTLFKLFFFVFALFYISSLQAQCLGGTVSTSDSDTLVYACPGDGTADIFHFASQGSATAASYTFVVTDDQDIILSITQGDSADFEASGIGTCRVYGLSYSGILNVVAGQKIDTAQLASTCHELSSNYVTVIKDVPNAGIVTTTAGSFLVFTCPGDGQVDMIHYQNTGTSNLPYVYMLVDANAVILAITTVDSMDFEPLGPGTCQVYGVSYSGNITATIGQNILTSQLSDGCFQLSPIALVIFKEDVDAGDLTLPSGDSAVSVCTGNGVADWVHFSSTASNGPSVQFTYLITDTQGDIIQLTSIDSLDFDGFGTGEWQVWGLAFTGLLGATPGKNIYIDGLSTSCYNLSDHFIKVTGDTPLGARVATSAGQFTTRTCQGDGQADILHFIHTSPAPFDYAFILTDDNDIIVSIAMGDSVDFEPLGSGTSHLWGVSYSGNLTVVVGQDINTALLSDDCYEPSSNFVTIIREQTDGARVATDNFQFRLTVCVGDGFPDKVKFINTSASPLAYSYLITDDQDNLLAVLPADSVDFEGNNAGVCRVYGLSYKGTIVITNGQNVQTAALSDDCAELSSNFVEVTRASSDAGQVADNQGNTSLTVCVDGIPDMIHFTNTGTGSGDYTYIFTDDNDIILQATAVDSADFDGVGLGIFRIHGVSHTGRLTANTGDPLTALSGDCFDLSSNFIRIETGTNCGSEVCDLDDFMPGNSTAYSVWLHGIAAIPGDEYSFDTGGGTMEIFNDGTAHITGRIELKNDPNYKWDVDVWLANQMDWTAWNALGRGYGGTRQVAINNHTNWDYWELDPNRSIFTGVAGSRLAGQNISLTERPVNFWKGFQKGTGANDKNGLFGMSGWFFFSGSYSGYGDFNTTTLCHAPPTLRPAHVNIMSPMNISVSGDLGPAASDPEGTAVIFSVAPANTILPAGNPQHGTLSLQPDGKYTYTPRRGYMGRDMFRVRVTDGGTPPAYAEGTVQIQVMDPVFLPVTLMSFEGERINENSNKLSWVTATELNASHFELEKSFDNMKFQTITNIQASGNSNQEEFYNFTDSSPMQSQNFYRLKLVDLDGRYSYSDVVEIKSARKELMISLYPNPAKEFVGLALEAGSYHIQLTDLAGRIIQEMDISDQDHSEYLKISVNGLSPAVYLIHVVDAKGASQTLKFVKKD